MLHIVDDPSLWHIDWGTRRASQVNPKGCDLSAAPHLSDKDKQFIRWREAAVRDYLGHIAQGGTNANWPGRYLCNPPAGMSPSEAARIRKGMGGMSSQRPSTDENDWE